MSRSMKRRIAVQKGEPAPTWDDNYLKDRKPCVLACAGCKRVVVLADEGIPYCMSYLYPECKWELGLCNFATHTLGLEKKVELSPMNALKRSKRKAKGVL